MGNRFEKKTATCKVYAEPSKYVKRTVKEGKRTREVDVVLYNIYRRVNN